MAPPEIKEIFSKVNGFCEDLKEYIMKKGENEKISLKRIDEHKKDIINLFINSLNYLWSNTLEVITKYLISEDKH